MVGKQIAYAEDVRNSILRGVEILARAVGATMGPRGQNVIIEKQWLSPTVTFDGVTVSKELNLPDPWEDMGVRLCKEAAIHTNERSGDGTTTATILSYALLKAGMQEIASGAHPLYVRQGMEAARDWVLEVLEENATKVESLEDVQSVARMACQDPEMAKLVAQAIDEVGRDGIITVEDGKRTETYLENVRGLELKQTGLLNSDLANQDDGTCILEDPSIFCYDGKLDSPMVVARLMDEALSTQRRSILFIADEFSKDVEATITQNSLIFQRQESPALLIGAVRTPLVGRKRKDILEDIAVLTGAEVCSLDKGDNPLQWKIAQCGTCARAKITRTQIELLEGDGKEEALQERVARLRHEIQEVTSDYDRQKLQERLSRLVGGMTILRVGATTEAELREKKRRMEDALSAVRAALEEGVVVGGGTALYLAGLCLPETPEEMGYYSALKAEKLPGYRVAKRATEACLRMLCRNACLEPGSYLHRVAEKYEEIAEMRYGVDVMDGEIKDLLAQGIVDPVRVLRCAWESAVSFAVTVLMTEVAIHSPEDKIVEL